VTTEDSQRGRTSKEEPSRERRRSVCTWKIMEPWKEAPAQWKHPVKEGRTLVKERKPQSKEKAPSK